MEYSMFIKDRKLWLFTLCGLLAFVLGFIAIKGNPAITIVSKWGYWVVLASFVIWVWSLVQSFREDVCALSWRKVDWLVVTVVMACGVILLVHEAGGFKILMDEILLASTSMSMHFDRTVSNATRGNDINGSFVLMDGMLDKRPLFHPFLVSLVHDFTGYRPENAIYLNCVLTFVFLGLVAVTGRKLAGRPGAVLSVLLFGGLPLMANNANGGGFELLNLIMALVVLLLGARVLERKDPATLVAFCFAAVLLVQVRYESVLLAMPVPLLIAWLWWSEKRVIMDWRLCLAPLVLVPYALHFQIFSLAPDKWQMQGKTGAGAPFSLGYIPENLTHALNFYFSAPWQEPSSLFFSCLGWCLMPFALLVVYRSLRKLGSLEPMQAATAIFFLGLSAHFVLMMAYFWGQFDDPIIRRLSLPSHLWLLVAVLLAAPALLRKVERLWFLVGGAALALFAVGVPAMATHAYAQLYWPARETAWRINFIKSAPARDFLVIDNDSFIWLTYKVSATTVPQAKLRREALQFLLKSKTFSEVYVFQHIKIDGATGDAHVREDDQLGPDFELQPVAEQRFTELQISRLSKLVAVRKGDVVQRAGEPRASAEVMTDPAQVEKLRHLYLENFVKQLP